MSIIFRTQNQVPEVYPRMSRDFQVLGRALDLIQNNVKYDTDKITDVLNTDICDSSLLSLLQIKIGFYSDKLIPDDDLRVILKAFPHIKFYKDSLEGVKRALNTYLKIRPTKLDSIRIVNTRLEMNVDGALERKDVYNIDILFSEQAYDLYILDEILKFIVPPGYNVRYLYVEYSDKFENTSVDFVDSVTLVKSTNSTWNVGDDIPRDNSIIRNIQNDIDLDYTGSEVEFSNEIKDLGEKGLISRARSSVNIGIVPNTSYKSVHLRRFK